MEDEYTLVSLFSGCGGLDKGLEQAGFTTLIANDVWDAAVDTYRKNFPDTRVLHQDATELETEEFTDKITQDVDIVTGGVPCKGFSQLNNRQLEHTGFEKDERNTLFEDFLRLGAACDPEFIVMENVRALVSRETSDGDYVRDNIIEVFENYGYTCDYKVLKAEQYGVPQKRRRVFFVGSQSGEPVFPEETHTEDFNTAGEALDAVHDDLPNMRYANTSDRIIEKISHVPQGGYYKHLPDKYKATDENGNIQKRFGSYLRRVDESEPALTVNSNAFIHPTQDRYLTPREMARLQTFPDDFIFTGNKGDVLEQIGNAVPVELGQVFGERLIEEL
jgi:DNA (cytosine-5)-methyltransferase 1